MSARMRLVCLIFGCMFCCTVGVLAQTSCSASASGAPCVDKVDPPNWWATLPNPMLLLHGNNLNGARVAVTGKKISVMRTQASANGHYLFVWLDTKSAGAQAIGLYVTTAAGATAASFELRARKPATAGFQGFSSRDVMYLIMTDRFANGDASNDAETNERAVARAWHGGNFRGIEQHLDYLRALGVTTVWTTPVYSNAGGRQAYHGYSATDMYGIDPHFGSLGDYQHLAQTLHEHGMKIVLDTVPNHVGAAHPWAKDPPTPDWFHGTVAEHDKAESDFHSLLDPHSAWRDQKDVVQGWFANVLPDLNQENPLVSLYLIQNAVWWVETAGLDGLRLDTFPYVGRTFWHDFHAELHALYPRLTTVGEVFNGDPTVTSYFAGGVARAGIDTGLDTPFDFPTYFALRKVFAHGQPMTVLQEVLRADFLYPHPERLATFFGNHDVARFLSEPGVTVGDLKIAFALLATMRGMPEIYSGDEIAMQGGDDPDNRRDFPGGFAGDAQNAFAASSRTTVQAEVFDWSSSLLHLRSEHVVLQTGQQQDVFADKTAFAFVRAANTQHGCEASSAGSVGERVLVAVNHSAEARVLALPMQETVLSGCSRFVPVLGAPSAAVSGNGTLTVLLGSEQAAIYLVH
jgi:neopullulanase